jgi:predicted phage terminase large subunit-like protein
MGSLQYVDFAEWKVGIFRLTYTDLSLPNSIMDRALTWLHRDNNPLLAEAGLAPHWDDKKKVFKFPSGAQIKFAHVQHEKDAEKYQGAEFHHLIFDEAVQITEKKITKITGSKRKNITDPLPLRTWFTGNPGGVSHEYFKSNYVDGPGTFINSTYLDNPYLDHIGYVRDSLLVIKDSDPILYRQWRFGDWNAIPQGKLFKRSWFTDRVYSSIPVRVVQWLRFWDLAATKEEDDQKKGGPDWTVGGLFGLGENNKVYLEEIIRVRWDEDAVWDLIIDTAKTDGRKISIRVEQEGASSGKMVIGQLARMLPGYDFDGYNVGKTQKIDRARGWIGFIKKGGLQISQDMKYDPDQPELVDINTFLTEVTAYPSKGIHDDQVDMLTGGLNNLFNIEEGGQLSIGDYKELSKLMDLC